MLIWIQTVEGY